MLEIVSLFVLVVTYIAQSEWTYLIPSTRLSSSSLLDDDHTSDDHIDDDK
jgi:hypothetical protein